MADSFPNERLDRSHNVKISALCALFGIGTWLPINALFTQMPIFTQYLPEGWSLPSHVSLLTQIANILPLLYYCFQNRLAPYQSILISVFLTIGTLSSMSLAFTYDVQVLLFGHMHSICFYIFSFGCAVVGCISSVTFLPFMNKLPEHYLVPFFIGEGLSGLLPSVMGVIQGVGDETCIEGKLAYRNPSFTSGSFLLTISFIMILSGVAFYRLNYYADSGSQTDQPTQYQSNRRQSTTQKLTSRWLFFSLLLLQAVVSCVSNGILPSVQSYSCLPYGASAYHWSVLMNQFVMSAIMFVAFFSPLVSLKVLGLCVMVEGLCFVYQLVTAFMSPTPPMVGTDGGTAVIVIVWMVNSCLIAYTKLAIASIFRRRYENGLIHYGLVTQIGSAFGSVISFVMINYLNVLHSLPNKQCN